MPISNITETTLFREWKTIFNQVVNALGDLATLATTQKTNLVSAINELDGDITTINNTISTINSDQTLLQNEINQAETNITNLDSRVTVTETDIQTLNSDVTTLTNELGNTNQLENDETVVTESLNRVIRITEKNLESNTRFSSDTGISLTTFDPVFSLSYYNSSAGVDGGKFINDNTDFGGDAGNLSADALDLLNTMSKLEKRYGAEFFINSITAGAGLNDPVVFNEINYYPVFKNEKLLSLPGDRITWMAWLRLKTNTSGNGVYLGNCKVNGISQIDYVLNTADNWVHVIQERTLTKEFEYFFPMIAANDTDVLLMALPVIHKGIKNLIHEGVI